MSDMSATAIEHFMQGEFVVVSEQATAVEAAERGCKINCVTG